MSRDVLTASLRSLAFQAEAIIAQLLVTHAVSEVSVTSVFTSEAIRRRAAGGERRRSSDSGSRPRGRSRGWTEIAPTRPGGW